MGLGDNIMATGMARGAAARGKRIAFGDGQKILWDIHSDQIFKGNPNIAPPGSERHSDIEWIDFYKGNRKYNRHDPLNNKWVWNYDFRPIPGEIYFSPDEDKFSAPYGEGFILVEPNVPRQKSVAMNKKWPMGRFQELSRLLKKNGLRLLQFGYPGSTMVAGVPVARTANFRQALSILKRASVYVGPEGGLHHGSAAVGTRAVVLFGGFIPPQVTGYDTHVNLTGGVKACGSLRTCLHCQAAMNAISVEEVFEATVKLAREER